MPNGALTPRDEKPLFPAKILYHLPCKGSSLQSERHTALSPRDCTLSRSSERSEEAARGLYNANQTLLQQGEKP